MIRQYRKPKAAPHGAGIATPVNTVAPVITGDTAGEGCSVSNGTWTNSSTFTYQWYLDGVAIAGETSNTITTDIAWAGQTLSAIVYGGNGAGKIGAASNSVVLQEASSYTGPLDLVPGALIAIDQFAPSSAYLAGDNNWTILRRSSDDALLQFQYNADGSPPLSQAVAWRDALGVANAYYATVNDGSGNGRDIVIAVDNTQPPLITSVIPTIPALGEPSTGATLSSIANINFTVGTPLTVFLVQNIDTDLYTQANMTQDFNANINFYNYPTFMEVLTSAIPSVGDRWSEDVISNGVKIIEWTVSSVGVVTLKINGVALTITGDAEIPIPEMINAYIAIAPDPGLFAQYFWPIEMSSGDKLSVRQLFAAKYGITLP